MRPSRLPDLPRPAPRLAMPVARLRVARLRSLAALAALLQDGARAAARRMGRLRRRVQAVARILG